MFNHEGSPTLSNVLFSGNYAYDAGGLFTDGGDPNLINVTFSGNRCDRYGTLHVGGGTPTVTNAIFWGNNTTINGTATVTYSIVQGVNYPGEGNLDVNPLSVDGRSYGEAPTTAGDYRLQYNFPSIEVGNNSPVTALSNLDDNPRLVDSNGDASSIVDMGAYEWQAYALTVNIDGGGTISKDPDRSTFGYLEQVSLSATTNFGWTFTGWSGDVVSLDNPLIVTMEGNTSIMATFTQIEYILTVAVEPEGAGSVTVDPVQDTYHYEDTVTLTPDGAPGWAFANWSGDASGTDNPLTVTIHGNTTITANFTQIEYTLIVNVSPASSGSVTVDPVQDAYHYEDTVTLTANANTGLTFAGWREMWSVLTTP